MPKVQNAIILLAGTGSRLRPLTDNTHKALLPIQGKTILERQITQLTQCGISKLHLVLGYRDQDICDFAATNFSDLNIQFHHNEIYEKTNTGYSLYLVLKTMAESFLLLDGDVLLHDKLLEALCIDTTDNLLLCETDPAKLDAEAVKVRLGDSGHIVEIGKPIALAKAHGESIGVGLYQKDWAIALKSRLESSLKDSSNWNWYYEDAMQEILANEQAPSPLKIISTENYPWVEVDDFQDLERAKKINWTPTHPL